MSDLNLILTVPYGIIVATSLGMEGFAKHRSPGSAKYFRGKTIQIDLALEGDRPAGARRPLRRSRRRAGRQAGQKDQGDRPLFQRRRRPPVG